LVTCTRLSSPHRQLFGPRKTLLSYHIVSFTKDMIAQIETRLHFNSLTPTVTIWVQL